MRWARVFLPVVPLGCAGCLALVTRVAREKKKKVVNIHTQNVTAVCAAVP